MEEDQYIVYIGPEIEDLIPGYLKNRHEESATLRAFLAAENFAGLEALAHRMIGVGTPYGFTYVTDIAKDIREAARGRAAPAIKELLDGYENYLRLVKVVVR